MRRSRSRGGIGAVVVGGDYQGLGIVRSLGPRGVPVCVIDDEHSIARYSRYTTCAVHADDLRDAESIVATVLDAGARHGLEGWVLYPTREEIVAAFSQHRDDLARVYRVPTPPWRSVKWAWDKRRMNERAAELGIPTPRTWYPRDAEELEAIDADFPLALKPAIKEHFLYATKAKAWRADDRPALRRLFAEAASLVGPGEVMIQELIPGDGRQQFAYCAFFKDMTAVGSMTARRRRQHPPEFGRASTYVETVELPELEALSVKFLRSIDYYGLVELEYKLDHRDGRMKLLDVNARTWGYHTLGRRAGVDFPYLVFADQLGEPVRTSIALPGIRWIRLTTDLPTGALEIVRGRLPFRQYLRSLVSFDVEAVFSREDPLPGLVEIALVPYLSVKRGF